MTTVPQLRPIFVEYVPDTLAEGELYISIEFATALHCCCCGCGCKVVTPLSPTDWRLIYDGETVSLDPSVGNWGFPCRSHYWVTRNRVRWAESWSSERVVAARELDRRTKDAYFDERERERLPQMETTHAPEPASPPWHARAWRRIRTLMGP